MKRLLLIPVAVLLMGQAHLKQAPEIQEFGDWVNSYFFIPNSCESTYGSAVCKRRADWAQKRTIEGAINAVTVHPDAHFRIIGTPATGFTGFRDGIGTGDVVDKLVATYGSLPWQNRPEIGIEYRTDTITPSGSAFADPDTYDPKYQRAPQGCPHGHPSHFHSASEVTGKASANQCGWPQVGMCSVASTRADYFCRCWGVDGNLDPDGSCVDALDVDCPGGTCQLTTFNVHDWLLQKPAATAASKYGEWRVMFGSLGRADYLCGDVTTVNATGCGTPPAQAVSQLIDPSMTGDYYVYQTYFDFDVGTDDPSWADASSGGGGIPPVYASAGTTASAVTCCRSTPTGADTSPGWAANRFAGGKAFINLATSNWQMRTIVSSTANTVTLSSPFNPAPGAGSTLGLLESGHTLSKRGIISGALGDVSQVAARKWYAAAGWAMFYDAGVPLDWPVVLTNAPKMGIWSKAPLQRNGYVSAPCATTQGFEGFNNYDLPTTAGGEGKCIPGVSVSAFGSRWAEGEYESYVSDIMKRSMDQVTGGVYPHARYSHTESYAANRFGQSADSGQWWGIDPAVHSNPKMKGARSATYGDNAQEPVDPPVVMRGILPGSPDAEVTQAFLAAGPTAMRNAGVKITYWLRTIPELRDTSQPTIMRYLGNDHAPVAIAVTLFSGTAVMALPAACAGLNWYDIPCMDAIAAEFAWFAKTYLDGQDYIYLANEIDNYFAANPSLKDELLVLEGKIRDAVCAVSEAKVGIVAHYDQSTDDAGGLLESIWNPVLDVYGLTVYGHGASFAHGDPADGITELNDAETFAENLGADWSVNETGWATAASLGSSEAEQDSWALQLNNWMNVRRPVRWVGIFTGFDCQPLSAAGSCKTRAVSLCGSGSACFDFISTLGLVRNDGYTKLAWSRIFTPMTALQHVQCSDGLDNDGDGAIDHPADTGCSSPTDITE